LLTSSPPAAEPRVRLSEALFAIEPALNSWPQADIPQPRRHLRPGYAC